MYPSCTNLNLFSPVLPVDVDCGIMLRLCGDKPLGVFKLYLVSPLVAGNSARQASESDDEADGV